ncbi:hypothetical protein P154DRAFT_564168 [Amniculicola lignicola CBS 123094]|uniref:Uncharacterized protein n=1 Tax=Amniculicola lignicola CBS 123094 TaxID=1392246 RepID=A0A6A5WJB6_9PLEO|nr:hypothetical protein P154DRAFT_564168 [Amniculicola lignicola CBS 123094]
MRGSWEKKAQQIVRGKEHVKVCGGSTKPGPTTTEGEIFSLGKYSTSLPLPGHGILSCVDRELHFRQFIKNNSDFMTTPLAPPNDIPPPYCAKIPPKVAWPQKSNTCIKSNKLITPFLPPSSFISLIGHISNLPFELRDQIYTYAVTYLGPIRCRAPFLSHVTEAHHEPTASTAIFLTNRKKPEGMSEPMWREVIRCFYKANDFEIDVDFLRGFLEDKWFGVGEVRKLIRGVITIVFPSSPDPSLSSKVTPSILNSYLDQLLSVQNKNVVFRFAVLPWKVQEEFSNISYRNWYYSVGLEQVARRERLVLTMGPIWWELVERGWRVEVAGFGDWLWEEWGSEKRCKAS